MSADPSSAARQHRRSHFAIIIIMERISHGSSWDWESAAQQLIFPGSAVCGCKIRFRILSSLVMMIRRWWMMNIIASDTGNWRQRGAQPVTMYTSATASCNRHRFRCPLMTALERPNWKFFKLKSSFQNSPMIFKGYLSTSPYNHPHFPRHPILLARFVDIFD